MAVIAKKQIKVVRKKAPVRKANNTKEVEPKVKNTPFYKSPKKIIFSLGAFLIVYLIFGKGLQTGPDLNTLKTKTIPEGINKVLSSSNMKVKEINNIKETSGVYEFELTLDGGNGSNNKFTSYITKDGKLLFQSGLKLDNTTKTTAPQSNQPQTNKLSCSDLNKSDNPKLTAYIVSNCPYGLQMQRAFNKALQEQPSLAQSLTVRYIGSIKDGKITSMHGDAEAQENLKQICIREEQYDKFWTYVSCYMKEGKTDTCLSEAQVNTINLGTCTNDANRGLKYAQTDFDMANKFNINSSPTLVLNDTQIVSEFDFGGRAPNAIKEVACCSYNSKPGFCGKDLTKDNVAVAFSTSDISSQTNSNPVSCGN